MNTPVYGAEALVRAALEEAASSCEMHAMVRGDRREKFIAERDAERIRAIAPDAIIAKVMPVDPVAHLAECHAFRVSPDGQDAEGHDWLEVAEPDNKEAFAVYAAPVLPGYDEVRELAEFEKWVQGSGFEKFHESMFAAWQARAALREGK
ncbi:hypothetical protein [Paludibacterium purpuratum]|uniref:Uncharacterized protein n=1 Tax=Paludibacterium purpuratum TaxID=1144873 RepID=A0A4R7BB40_9NEIS|nr:hypothetical protein [Paludibacterium purpuratum]TDR82164.1 hypothetical protein DFP86_102278 [Paludibacterium purpuratum]